MGDVVNALGAEPMWDYLTLPTVLAAAEVAGLACWPAILLSRKRPVPMLAWLMGVTFLPVLGPLLYLLVGRNRIRRGLPRRKRRSARRAAARLAYVLPDHAAAGNGGHGVADSLLPLLQLQAGLGPAPLTRGNRVTLLPSGAETYRRLFEDIARALVHVRLEYYLLEEDAVGGRLADLLRERARAGVEVELLLDALGSFGVSAAYVEALREAGVRVAWFHPLNPLARRFSLNLRNHRKIAVIDGRIGYVGGVNLAERYMGSEGDWADLSIRIEGAAVYALQRIFLEDWGFTTRKLPDRRGDYPPLDPTAAADGNRGGLVQIMPSGPDEDWGNMRRVYFAALSVARRQAWLMTPYFIPDDTFQAAMESAALRGVDVRVVVPRRSDNRLADLASRRPCADLIAAGVRIFRYAPGMLHGKALLIDGVWMVIGSANMDVRSFRLNFEAGALIHDEAVGCRLQEYFEAQMAHAAEAVREEFVTASRIGRAGEALVRLLSPLL